jgi:hypothetical protein
MVSSSQSIQKLDGITGQPYPAYTVTYPEGLSQAAVHTDGTIFALDTNLNLANPYSVIGIDPVTGTQKFSIPLPHGTTGVQRTGIPFDSCATENYGSVVFSLPSSPVIAGDGFAYVAYTTRDHTMPVCQLSDAIDPTRNCLL